MSRQFSEETPDVVLSAATARLDALACVLRRDSWSGDSGMCAEERGVLLELMADMASAVRRLAQVNEAYVNQLQALAGRE
jgi:cobalamin biosynthesis Mg chelatase CobN